MCDPISMMVMAGVAAAGSIMQGEAANDAAKYNAAISEQNAQLAERYAEDALAKGEKDAQRQRVRTGQVAGEQRAALGAAGYDLSVGTPLDILSDTAAAGEIDVQNIIYNSQLDAVSKRADGVNFRNSATMQRAEGKQARNAGYFDAATTLIGGASKSGMFGKGGFTTTTGSQGATWVNSSGPGFSGAWVNPNR